MKTKISLLTILVVALLAGNAFAANVLLEVRTSFDGDNEGLVWTNGVDDDVDNSATGPDQKNLWFSGDWRQTDVGSVVGYYNGTSGQTERSSATPIYPSGSPTIYLNVDPATESILGATEVSFSYSDPTYTSDWYAYVVVTLNEALDTSNGDLWGFDGSGSVFMDAQSTSTQLVFGLLDTDTDLEDNIYNDFHVWVTDEEGYSFIIESLTFYTETALLGENGEVIQLESLQYNPAATPIPGAAWLLGSGLIGLVGLRRRFRA